VRKILQDDPDDSGHPTDSSATTDFLSMVFECTVPSSSSPEFEFASSSSPSSRVPSSPSSGYKIACVTGQQMVDDKIICPTSTEQKTRSPALLHGEGADF